MAITLRGNKSQALTFNEMDGNFTDLDGRVTTLEGSTVQTINGLSPSSNAVTITTANITENTNLYYTDARARAAISVTDVSGDGSLSYNSSTGVITYTGPSASEVRAHFTAGEGIDISSGEISGEDASTSNKGIASFNTEHFTVSSGAVSLKADSIDDTHIDFGTGTNQVSTADVPEQTNLYYTDGRADARIAAASIDDLSDVELGVSQTDGHGLVWNAGANRIELAELPGAAGGEANTGINVGGFNEIFQGKAGVSFNFRTIDHGDNITITQNTDDIVISLVSSPEFGNIKINSEANTIENIATNSNIVLKPNGTGIVSVDGALTASGDITGTLATAAQTNITSLGTLTALQVDNINIDGNTISSTAGTDLNITPLAGQQIVLDSTIVIDAGVVTGATSITSTALNATSAIIDEVTISANNITTNTTNANLVLLASGTGVVEVDSNIDMNSNKVVNVTDPTSAQDAATKAYVDSQVSAGGAPAISQGNSDVTVTDSGTGQVVTTIDGTAELTIISASATFGGNIIIPDAGNIGSASDTDAIAIASNGNVTFSQDVTVTGDLTVNGDTTTVSTTNMVVSDNLIELNNGASSNANDSGIVIERGSTGDNAFIGWDESSDKFIVGTTTATGASTGDLTISTGTLVATLEGNVTGDLTGNADSATTSTNVTVADESTDTTCNVLFVTGATGDLPPKTGTNLTFNSANGTLTTTTFSGALSGNATTATTLETARNIGGVSFDGSANINLPGVNTAGNQDTSGTAAVATAVTVADESTDTSCNVLFTTAATGDLAPKSGTNLTFNSSNGTLSATTFSGVATSAQYADLAEKYTTDEAYLPGTVMTVGGDAETTAASSSSQYIAGVISTDPAYLMNSTIDGQAIALVGRVPVRVVGNVTKGQAVFATDNGVASTDGTGPIVGIALETNSNSDEKSVECMLKV